MNIATRMFKKLAQKKTLLREYFFNLSRHTHFSILSFSLSLLLFLLACLTYKWDLFIGVRSLELKLKDFPRLFLDLNYSRYFLYYPYLKEFLKSLDPKESLGCF